MNYRCTSLDCRKITANPDWTDSSFVDFEGRILKDYGLKCPSCGSPVRIVPELTSVLGEIARAGAGIHD